MVRSETMLLFDCEAIVVNGPDAGGVTGLGASVKVPEPF